MKKMFIIIGIILAVTIAIIYLQFDTKNQVLREYGIDGLTTVQMVEALESKTIPVSELNASISATSLVLTKNGVMYRFDVPNNLFYLSIAPYITQTHPCGTHNLVTCRGELSNQAFDVTIISKQGQTLFEGQKVSQDNGFFGIWLPRDVEADVYIRYGNMESMTTITTFEDSNTCLTTMRLS